ncbi:hypothetical protein [Amorphus coralli]|uniref:hypothetical protein n=1 Tax=Amorphus coralli TaxID=340680 RepID=UPI00037DA93E|nr:hypothetical protein [Amorphus coralli]
MADEKRDPFHPYVQELQGQEGDIDSKIAMIEAILKGVDVDASYDGRFKEAKAWLKELKKKIAERKIEDLEKELEDLQGLAQNPGGFNPPPPPPPWIWPWPWPPPPGFPGPGSGTPGVINVGIVTPPSDSKYKVGLAERDFIVARSKSKVWVWDPLALVWAAELDASDEIVEMDKVDGTVAVRTATSLWLFHPLDYRWLGPLDAEIVEVTAYNLAFPTVVKAEG